MATFLIASCRQMWNGQHWHEYELLQECNSANIRICKPKSLIRGMFPSDISQIHGKNQQPLEGHRYKHRPSAFVLWCRSSPNPAPVPAFILTCIVEWCFESCQPPRQSAAEVGWEALGKPQQSSLELELGRVTEPARCYCQPRLKSHAELIFSQVTLLWSEQALDKEQKRLSLRLPWLNLLCLLK